MWRSGGPFGRRVVQQSSSSSYSDPCHWISFSCYRRRPDPGSDCRFGRVEQAAPVFFATLRWIIIELSLLLGLAVIYYFGPDAKRKFQFISPGNLVGAALIASASIGFRTYVSHFGSYNATYGSLGAVIILMLWLYLSGIALLAGSEIDALLGEEKRQHHK